MKVPAENFKKFRNNCRRVAQYYPHSGYLTATWMVSTKHRLSWKKLGDIRENLLNTAKNEEDSWSRAKAQRDFFHVAEHIDVKDGCLYLSLEWHFRDVNPGIVTYLRQRNFQVTVEERKKDAEVEKAQTDETGA